MIVKHCKKDQLMYKCLRNDNFTHFWNVTALVLSVGWKENTEESPPPERCGRVSTKQRHLTSEVWGGNSEKGEQRCTNAPHLRKIHKNPLYSSAWAAGISFLLSVVFGLGLGVLRVEAKSQLPRPMTITDFLWILRRRLCTEHRWGWVSTYSWAARKLLASTPKDG